MRSGQSEIYKARDYVAVFPDEDAVRSLQPDMAALAAVDMFGRIVTAPWVVIAILHRLFVPGHGVNEDPVTMDSAHCSLIPFWAERLGKTKLYARQVSKRGGELFCELRGDRVTSRPNAALHLKKPVYIESASRPIIETHELYVSRCVEDDRSFSSESVLTQDELEKGCRLAMAYDTASVCEPAIFSTSLC